MRTLESVCLWYISRRKRARPVVIESDEDRQAREYDEMISGRLEFGLMDKTHFHSSRAVDEARKGPKAVLRNERGEHIESVILCPVVVVEPLEVASESV
jgi:hypothetical protein